MPYGKRSSLWLLFAAVAGGLAVAVGVVVTAQVRDDSPAANDTAPDPESGLDETDAVESPLSEVDSAAALAFFEEKLVGGWSRYHSYDGSTQYVIFDSDRTACKWEETSSGSTKNDSSFGHSGPP